jgi:hypothetical protein
MSSLGGVEMDSVFATNPVSANPVPPSAGVTDAIQLITNSAPPALASLLSSASVKSALQQAPASDLVKLSDQALQLQLVDGLFGSPDASPSNSGSALDSFLDQLSAPVHVSTASQPAATAATPSPAVASQLGIFQGQLEAENTQPLFASSAAAASGSNVNLLA